LFAKHQNGTFILRIEDTDRARFVPEAEWAIREILEWLGLAWDEEYKQSERLAIYKKYGDELFGRNLAYEDGGALRFRMPKEGKTEWTDAIGSKDIAFENSLQEDFVILKTDGYPTYNFANVVDDHLMWISHVIRGEEFISSTPKHIQLYKAFGWNPPVFAHQPVVLGPDRQKLSKRHGAKSVLEYRAEGYLREALLNYMALLGWNPGGDREIMDLAEMVEQFDLKDINTASPIFDGKKLEWMNGVYIRRCQTADLKSQILLQSTSLKKIDSKALDAIIPLAKERMRTLREFDVLVLPWFDNHGGELTPGEKKLAKVLLQGFSSLKPFDVEGILAVLKKACNEANLSMRAVYKIFTGSDRGLPVADMISVLGREGTVRRLKRV
jgi:glutamyl-tRNA synthetase